MYSFCSELPIHALCSFFYHTALKFIFKYALYRNINNYFNNYGPDAVDQGAYNVSLDKLVCPCCGKKLHLVDSMKKEYEGDDLIKVNESVLTENKLSDYLLGIIEEEARAIYEDELETNEPETDEMGNIVGEYGERFLY